MLRHSGHIDIEKPLQLVSGLFIDANNLKEWQEGFVKKELIRGTANTIGAVSVLYYKNKKYEMELVETITSNRLPYSFEVSYSHKHMDNTMKYVFTALNGKRTRYEYHAAYTRIDWIMPRLFSNLFPSMYTKPGARWMKNFKSFAEKQ